MISAKHHLRVSAICRFDNINAPTYTHLNSYLGFHLTFSHVRSDLLSSSEKHRRFLITPQQ